MVLCEIKVLLVIVSYKDYPELRFSLRSEENLRDEVADCGLNFRDPLRGLFWLVFVRPVSIYYSLSLSSSYLFLNCNVLSSSFPHTFSAMMVAFKKKSSAYLNFPKCSYSMAPLLYAIANVNFMS